MKRIFILFITAAILIVSYYLYQHQLGAIAFFFFAVYFFYLAYKEYTNKIRKNGKKKI
ncbi:hypothetical protein J9303_06225 [Bacillaceae bacterium Marseille-Q3522]|nr:hypothetical protein [Bacillaceae bacterium Marseille-Q3522]